LVRTRRRRHDQATIPTAAEQLAVAVLGHLSDGIVTCDADGYLTLFNGTTRRLHGDDVTRIPPEQWAAHYHLYRSDGVTPMPLEEIPLWRALQGEIVVDAELVIAPPGAPARVVLCGGEAIYDDDGRKLGAAVAMRDVTEAREVSAVVRQQLRSLELLQRVAVAAHEASTLDDVLRAAITDICHLAEWPVGHAYRAEGQRLVPTRIWHCDDPDRYATFRAVTDETAFRLGEGLPGRVATSKVPEIVERVTSGVNFPRAEHGDLGVTSGFALPVLLGSEVVAVLEFFAPETRRPSPALLDVMANIGTQLGRVVERERAHALLAERERQLARAQAIARLASWEWEPATGRMVWSAELRAMVGLADDEADPSFDELLTWTVVSADQAKVRAAFAEALRKGGSFEVEHRLPRRDGAILTVRARGEVLHGRDGRAERVLGTAQDITEQQRASEALRASEERARLIVETASDAVVEMDAAGRITGWNRQAERVFGWTREEVLGRPLAATIVPPSLRATHDAGLARFRETGEGRVLGQRLELPALRRDGTEFPVEIAISAVTAGAEPRFTAFIQDITERKAAEHALQEANDHLARTITALETRNREVGLLHSMGDLLQSCVSLDETGDVLRHYVPLLLPAASGALYTLSPSQNALEALTTWGPEPTAAVLASDECWAFRRGRVHAVERGAAAAICAHASGAATSICVPMMAQGDILGLLHLVAQEDGVLGDEARVQLATTVAERVALALANFRLRETLRNQSIRDPLTGLFNRRYLEETLDRELLRASRSGLPLSVLMVDVDHFKRFNDTLGHPAGDAMLVAVARLLCDRLRSEDVVCRYGGEEFVVVLPEADLETAQARAEQLRAAARQLSVSSAGRHLPPVTLSLGVASYRNHGDTRSAVLTAADAALYRAKHQGRDQVVVAGATSTDATCGGVTTAHAGETVLVVEDDRVVLALVSQLLAGQGYTVLQAADGAAALELAALHRGQIHLLVTDVEMPHVDGLELASTLAARRPELRTLFLSAFPRPAGLGGSDAAARFLSKDAGLDNLTETVRHLLDAPVGAR
jgi:diguanylate cyclase (GGDEF)-like protein/PAS domain S-box-containing protein